MAQLRSVRSSFYQHIDAFSPGAFKNADLHDLNDWRCSQNSNRDGFHLAECHLLVKEFNT
ncbi:unnamed protein product, partial [Amoebophrya sp. A120]|eukprot:GSA120T00017569001.1